MQTDATLRPAWFDHVNIRQLEQRDLSALEWEGEYTHFRRLYANAFQRMRQGLSIIWIAELPGASLIGQVFLQLDCDRKELADGSSRAYLYSFRIKPKFRNIGIGGRILNVVEQDLIQRRYGILTLNVARDNYSAMRFYDRHGFRITAEESGIWDYQDEMGNWQHVEEPAWRMEKIISI
jgi:ribosomal protein S18 acetylase RimI-like enzyme